MTAEEFNKLPLDARQFIEKQKPCCGRSNDLDALYKSFLVMKNTELYLLRIGAVNFKKESGETGILYPIHPTDTEDQVNAKLTIALAVSAVAPDAFEYIQEDKIKVILGEQDSTKSKGVKNLNADKDSKSKTKTTAPKVNADGVPVDKNGKPLTGGPLKNALGKLAVIAEETKGNEDPKFEGKDGKLYDTEDEALASLEDLV